MSTKTRGKAQRARRGAPADGADTPNPRQPCPCGSGKRYKACHGSGEDAIVLRPFAGLAAECDLVAMREMVPSGQAVPALADGAPAPAEGREVRLVTVLPGAAAAMVREGEILVALQVQTRSGDISTDLARALRWALDAEPGEVLPVVGPGLGGDPVRLQDLLVADSPLEVTVHSDFAWWLPPGETPSPDATAALERANKAIMPTEPLTGTGLRGAYWVDAGAKAHLRWVRPEPEDQLVAALARLAAADRLALGEGSRYAGSFRAHGVLVPVWDLDRESHPKEWVGPAEEFAVRLTETLASLEATPLTDAERRARDSLAGRQVTLR